jgi:hypothetical protein
MVFKFRSRGSGEGLAARQHTSGCAPAINRLKKQYNKRKSVDVANMHTKGKTGPSSGRQIKQNGSSSYIARDVEAQVAVCM